MIVNISTSSLFILKNILSNFEKINKLTSKEILEGYLSHCLIIGKEISVKTSDKKITGKVNPARPTPLTSW